MSGQCPLFQAGAYAKPGSIQLPTQNRNFCSGTVSFKNVMTFYPLGSVDLGKVHSSSVPIHRLVIPFLHSLHTHLLIFSHQGPFYPCSQIVNFITISCCIPQSGVYFRVLKGKAQCICQLTKENQLTEIFILQHRNFFTIAEHIMNPRTFYKGETPCLGVLLCVPLKTLLKAGTLIPCSCCCSALLSLVALSGFLRSLHLMLSSAPYLPRRVS